MERRLIMNRYQYKYSLNVEKQLQELMKKADSAEFLRKIQCIYLRAAFNYTPKEISKITGLSISRVRQIHTAYRQKGISVLYAGRKGGRNHAYMAKNEEMKFLEAFKQESEEGRIVEVRKIQQAYEKKVNRRVHKSTIYDLLHRYGWRKIFPRSIHPNHNEEAIDSFKKTLPYWYQEDKNKQN